MGRRGEAHEASLQDAGMWWDGDPGRGPGLV